MAASPGILFLHSGSEIFGSERALVDLAKQLQAAGWRTCMLLPEDGPAVALFEAGGSAVEVAPLAAVRRGLCKRRALALLIRLHRPHPAVLDAARRFAPTVVYSNTSHLVDGPAVARRLKAPHVWHVREIERIPETWRRALGFLLRSSGTVIVISRAVGASLFGRGIANTLGRGVAVVPDGIEVSDFPLQLITSPPSPRLVLPGRFTPWKGQDRAVRAFARAHAQHPYAELLLIGEATTEADRRWVSEVLEPLVDQTEGVKIIGPITDQSEIYEGALALVQSSIRTEPFGRTVLEAMASGVVPLAPDVGGPAEVVEHGVTGLLYQAGDETALAAAMDRVLRLAPDELLAMTAAARRRVEVSFTSAGCASAVTELLRRSR